MVEIATSRLPPPTPRRAAADPPVPKANALRSLAFGISKHLWADTPRSSRQRMGNGRMSIHSKVQEARSPEHRRVLIAGMLVTPAGDRRVMIRDISPGGAHVTCREKLPSNCDVLLKRGSLFAAARMAAVSGDEASLRFYRELSNDEIEGALMAGAQ